MEEMEEKEELKETIDEGVAPNRQNFSHSQVWTVLSALLISMAENGILGMSAEVITGAADLLLTCLESDSNTDQARIIAWKKIYEDLRSWAGCATDFNRTCAGSPPRLRGLQPRRPGTRP